MIFNLKRSIILMCLIASSVSLQALAEEWTEGEHYTVLKKSVNMGKADQPEVIEFFYYGCPHCNQLQPYMHNWLKLKPANIEFFRVPVAFAKAWEWSAKLYHTGDQLKVLERVHPIIFKTHHGGRPIRSEADMIAIFKQVGVSQKQFEATYNGFVTNSLVSKSQKLVEQSNLNAVPAVVVNGKYLTNVPDAGNQAKLIKLINWLLKHNP